MCPRGPQRASLAWGGFRDFMSEGLSKSAAKVQKKTETSKFWASVWLNFLDFTLHAIL